MIILEILFRKRGLIKTVMFVQQRIVNVKWYSEQCLPQLAEQLQELRTHSRLRTWLMDLDNAPVHRAALTTDYLKQIGLPGLGDLPHCSTLPPYDFALCPRVERQFKRCCVVTTAREEEICWN
ncbi:hypothetical protein ABEB36_004333 [Hypothenemus hampei]|uniref:Tc1-like transposase DDE domain-containing protein n=1 Tax=Hypothenemus hampei TaxID=57062 RepID=A0ABD1F647_HYPHA